MAETVSGQKVWGPRYWFMDLGTGEFAIYCYEKLPNVEYMYPALDETGKEKTNKFAYDAVYEFTKSSTDCGETPFEAAVKNCDVNSARLADIFETFNRRHDLQLDNMNNAPIKVACGMTGGNRERFVNDENTDNCTAFFKKVTAQCAAKGLRIECHPFIVTSEQEAMYEFFATEWLIEHAFPCTQFTDEDLKSESPLCVWLEGELAKNLGSAGLISQSEFVDLFEHRANKDLVRELWQDAAGDKRMEEICDIIFHAQNRKLLCAVLGEVCFEGTIACGSGSCQASRREAINSRLSGVTGIGKKFSAVSVIIFVFKINFIQNISSNF